MSAFEEAGVAPELISAVDELGWTLPTPIQAEAVPLILGGGDVMAAAETGSGKTGAFALPVLQIVHEALRTRQAARQAGGGGGTAPSAQRSLCVLNAEDRDAVFAISGDGLRCQARSEQAWGGCRGTVGAFSGRVYYEATVSDEGLCRVGWSTQAASLDLGTDKHGFGYGGTGKKSHVRQFEDYGEPYGLNDTVGCLLDSDGGTISYTKNGALLGPAFQLPQHMRGQAFYPAVCLKNAELQVNFGGSPFKHAPPPGYGGLASAPRSTTASWQEAPAGSGGGGGKPLAIILEPARDLAEQTHNNITLFRKHLRDPSIRNELLVGGTAAAAQLRALKEGVDIVVGTPGRVMDFMETGKLPTDQVQFFVLDEADRLLDTGNQEVIMKMFQRFPKGGSGVARLQVLLFSATLHSPEVRALAGKICQNPIIIDLKGKDAVPEAVHHVLVRCDPQEDRSWLQSAPAVHTDAVHALDQTGPNLDTPENWSEAVKRLKQRYLQRVLDAFQMEQCLIFCRTNFDCDNLELFLNSLGGGSGGGFRGKRESGVESRYSCVVLAGARSMDERRAALQAFKDGDVRFLICTDVAARGIDIQGLPYVINMTLPDRSEDYIHRVGRVGRADTMGLAISLVSSVPEKVWFCTQKGYKPWLQPDAHNTRTNEEGGQTTWYDEPQLLQDIEKRLSRPIAALDADLSLPADIAAHVAGGGGGSEVQYGQQRGGGVSKEVAERVAAVRPAVQGLARLEFAAQSSFYELKRKWAATAAHA
ncbi:ATP-dependent RNA helicase DDX1 [Micractinium conductrix]|uniref:DEAD box protein 1 n=1 Tax=Micractinium conductrix TaxID=554055 RepID=A0A2P6VLQ4_9CHLO|nr:ATP-dependent RNA helicase DDX1 [Micractinium conductrix]|eukprot:PSC75014.1 ATP-dependent RNA helicase DDX1 [Micractinium conductrix]